MLKSCLEAAILYGYETCSSTSLLKLEKLYRKVIKITFSMSKNTPNEIIYIETEYAELKAEIYKRQYKFWSKIIMSIDNDPDNSISTLYKNAIDKIVQYLRHYKKLQRLYTNRVSCFNEINSQFREKKIRNNVTMKAQRNEYSTYHHYILLNKDLVSPTMAYYKHTASHYAF